MSMIHMYQDDLGPAGPMRAYCGRVDDGGLDMTFAPRDAECITCRKAMARDWCAECGRLLVAWDADDVCQCGVTDHD